jgi:cell wall-associated NlpC family hydrolase
MHKNSSHAYAIFLGLGLAFPEAAVAQFRGVDVSYGRWWHGDGVAAEVYTATWNRHLAGPVEYGLGITHVADGRSLADGTLTGGEASLTVGGHRGGVYGTVAAGLGIEHKDGSPDAQWSIGLGYALYPFSFLRFAFDARYRLEDQSLRGFWNLAPTDRRGVSVRVGLALRFHEASSPPRTRVAAVPPNRPSLPPLATVGRYTPPDDGEAGAALRHDVVATALEAMGSPYRWGGADENGFDCSGLIQYAYGAHGIILPRVSAQQARTGTMVETDVAALQPGDILGFAVRGSRVSHVGLYIGDGQFIHSASNGVRVSDLMGNDPDSDWYRKRWVAARRIFD